MAQGNIKTLKVNAFLSSVKRLWVLKRAELPLFITKKNEKLFSQDHSFNQVYVNTYFCA